MKKGKKQRIKYHPIVTRGEALHRYLRTYLDSEGPLNSSTRWLAQFNRSLQWCSYIEEFMSLNLTGQLIESGRFLRSKYENTTVFETEYRSVLCEQLTLDRSSRDRLFRLCSEAVEASLESIANGTRNALKTWAKASHPHCYLCGRDVNFVEPEDISGFTLDHLWPRDFGGDSIAENLLPACKDCNSKHKKNYATWAMTNIQSILVGFEPSENRIKRVTGSSRFAIHHRHVQAFAIEFQLTMKEAYLQVGPSDEIRITDPLEFGHFFNLVNHNSTQ